MYKLLIPISLFFLSLVGCTNDDDDNIDCSAVACTEEFRSFNITLTDTNDNPIALNQFTVTDITNKKDLTTELSPSQLQWARQTGMYPLYGDQFARIHQNKVIEIVFSGVYDNNEVVNALFTAGADCCHTEIISGNLEIIVN